MKLRVLQSVVSLLLLAQASVAFAMSDSEIALSDKKSKPSENKVEKKSEVAEHAERAAAAGRLVDEYTGKISAKIRRGILIPQDVPNDARAEFAVTVLPDGSVESLRILKSSGYAAYDKAVMRAIHKAQPLPLPPDAALFNRFRELKLVFRPTE